MGSVRGSRFERRVDRGLHVLLGGSMLRSRSNCSVICELPKLDTEVIWLSDGICPNWRSSGVVTADAMVSALAPGR